MPAATERRQKQKGIGFIFMGLLIFAATVPALLLLSAVLLQRGSLPPGCAQYLVLVSVFLAAVFGGLAGAMRQGRGGLKAGAVCGAAFAAALFVISVSAPRGDAFTAMQLKLTIAALTGGAFGGTLTVKRGGRKKYRR